MPEYTEPVVSRIQDGAAIHGESATWMGVYGRSESSTGGQGVLGEALGTGVAGVSRTWVGVYGESNGTENGPAAVWAEGRGGAFGVKGHARAPGAAGVAGFHLADTGDGGPGVLGESVRGVGVRGVGGTGVVGVGRVWIGVYGESDAPVEAGSAGVWGDGKDRSDGVKGVTRAPGKAAVSAFHLTPDGPGMYAEGSPAAYFRGDVVVTGDLRLEGADYAEELTVADVEVAPGMVVVLDDQGRVRPCLEDYDPRVAGVVAGAGGVRSALVLDRHPGGAPIAMMGKVWVMADADAGRIRPGDLLTTSTTPGHARRVDDRQQAFGALIGKALTGLTDGRGMVRMLVTTT
ncbi:hypothetical protein [Pseudonocardia broussonetiae]|uniref:Uncharacterized protein n=1 Tax=Pseudonocardia broussonetiae TaxID=2736640 RepID=A0A6M6JQ14_9PSEU|nr:hypothetical protein [Pseudonocardia broussonetiae]QJY49988.1 hypothetical protein HOP40_32960 [Pseudonocardia broussonetiae]